MSGYETQEYRELLQSGLPSAVDADTVTPDFRTLFTPDSHRLALDPDVTVVRGARGAGKTVWFRALQDDALRAIASDAYQLGRLRNVRPLTGYGAELKQSNYPGPSALFQLMRENVDPDVLWSTVLLCSFKTPELVAMARWQDRVEWTMHNPDRLDATIEDVDRHAGEKGEVLLVLFDALDRLHPDRSHADRLITGVLRRALELRTRTRHIRAKVFIRHDMFDSNRLHFPDASKLVANRADLTWSVPNLYGLLFHQLGNAAHPMAADFRTSTGQWRETAHNRHDPPADLVGDSQRQQAAFTRLAGPYMGTNHRKGHTYTWLPNHLMDGKGQVSPRSFLRALSEANTITRARFAGHETALHWEGIRGGVQAASEIRVKEIAEDIPWVATALEPLAGLQVPVDKDAILQRWQAAGLYARLSNGSSGMTNGSDEPTVRTGPRNATDGEAIVAELVDLGVMSRRTTGRIDLPDVYRIAFKIGRKGGVPRVKT
jgi:hypothetical protein